jgi:formylglycine-generating enzyme required for sulfatase activity
MREHGRTIFCLLSLWIGFVVPVGAQEVSVPDPALNAVIREALQKPAGPLTQQDLLSLTILDASNRSIGSAAGLEAAGNLISLNLFNNHLTNFVLPGGFRNLAVLDLGFNSLAQCSLPDDLTNLNTLFLEGNALTDFILPAGLTALTKLDLAGNALNRFALRPEMTNLAFTLIFANQLTNLSLPPNLHRLLHLDLNFNRLANLTLPVGLSSLNRLDLRGNQLTDLILPADMTQLSVLDLGLNQLTQITLPRDLANLTALFLDGNPLTTFVLSDPLAAANLADTVALLRSQGVSVFTYPLTVQLIRIRQPVGAFQFAITGPPGAYAVLASTNLTDWTALNSISNPLGAVVFTDGTAHLSLRKFYRALQQTAPTNMVFIPPNTFMMGSLTNELHRNMNEGPQTAVTLSRGFWIGKYEVTQGEYVSIMNTNPSFFPGELSRPVSSMSWPDATNYCAKLTERELAGGRIPPGSRYRLPTEAEWECAARAGTSTRFSYGDDPNYTSLTNHAWYFLNAELTVHPVGQKLPNPWGLYDMEGNVWEWCQDWLGPLPGGAVTDPQGPPSNPIGVKVVRGGAYDFAETDCRSARRFSFGVHPALNDTDLGFRVVLVSEPQ